jgi:hypothetical protein
MSQPYRELVKQARSLIESVGRCDSKIEEIKKSLAAIEQEKASWPTVNLDDPAALRKISDQRLRHELLPGQLETVEIQKGEHVEQLEKVLKSLEVRIRSLADEETNRTISRIAPELTKYCGDDGDTARRIAAGLPIVAVIGVAANWVPTVLMDRSSYPESYRKAVLAHADQLLGILDRYEANRHSFIPENFGKAV